MCNFPLVGLYVKISKGREVTLMLPSEHLFKNNESPKDMVLRDHAFIMAERTYELMIFRNLKIYPISGRKLH